MSGVLDDEDRETEIEGLLVEDLECGGWRLCDELVDRSDAGHVIAYVEPCAAGYEVVWLSGPRRRQIFPRWSSVMTAAGRRLGGGASRGPVRPLRIRHLPPPG
ncbi:hypothetical protein N3K63_13350 [Microbacterium sp. W1N]|uniref:hypothetical protein n=1 Tax=Microbacterium festucae TaxID=2977531 RepID=UPI0021C0FAEE|nr:hypothetical protein [Microbacterium festucae]MCT9821265.1 hypothetical protein [Microbacterium festucae]